jgi:hypothetical protein
MDLLQDDPAVHACTVVHRYLTEALLGGDERALRETVADPELAERAWLFWAAFTDRQPAEPQVLFADATGTYAAAHLETSAVQVGPWITGPADQDGAVPVTLECTATFVLAGGCIIASHETWR